MINYTKWSSVRPQEISGQFDTKKTSEVIERSKQKQSQHQAERLDPIRNIFIPYSWHSVRNVFSDPGFSAMLKLVKAS